MSNVRFVGESLQPASSYIATAAFSHGEPPLPTAFRWNDEELPVHAVLAMRRTTKTDRGDDYLAKHWYAFTTSGGRTATIYFDRKARVGRPRWWLYSITDDALPEA